MRRQKKPLIKQKTPRRPRIEEPYTAEQQEADFLRATGRRNGKDFVRSLAMRVLLLQRVAQGPAAKWRAEANYKLGAWYEDMYGNVGGRLKLDRYVARNYYKKAAADGHHPASIRMLQMDCFPDVYIKARPDAFTLKRGEKPPKNPERITELMDQKRYAEVIPIMTYYGKRGMGQAQYSLYCLYTLQAATPTDDNALRGRAWCYLAAKKRIKAAQSALGCDLVFDSTIPDEEAESWLRRAARRNDREAIAHLGLSLMLSRDLRRKPDIKSGLNYLEKAAALGSPFAMLRLGEIYLGKVFKGSVIADRDRAKSWYLAAADIGDLEARELLRKDFDIKYDGPVLTGGERKTPTKSRRNGPQKPTIKRAIKKK